MGVGVLSLWLNEGVAFQAWAALEIPVRGQGLERLPNTECILPMQNAFLSFCGSDKQIVLDTDLGAHSEQDTGGIRGLRKLLPVTLKEVYSRNTLNLGNINMIM